MPRIRSIKPDFFKSEDVSALPLRARLTWIGLWTQCDDHGRYKDSARLIKGDVWSLDDVALRDIEEDLAALAAEQRIVRYEVDGKAYLAITNWHAHQAINRPSRPKHPAPPMPMASADPDDTNHCDVCAKPGHGSVRESSVNTHGTLTAGRERKGREGRGGDARAGVREPPPAPTLPPPQEPDEIQPETPTAQPAPGDPPPDRCPKHVGVAEPPSCRACGRAREAREQWDRDQADALRRADLERRSREARDRAATNATAIARCQLCDERGYLPSGRQCTHDPERVATNGSAAAREVAAKRSRPATREAPPDPVAEAMARRAAARADHQPEEP